jgi:hypothetical protein
LDVAVVNQWRTLDEAVAGLREALTSPLHKQLEVGTLQAIVRQAARFTLIRSSDYCSAISAWGYRQSLQG